VHQAIEEIHRWVLDGKMETLNESRISEFFQFSYRNLLNRGLRPIGPKQREAAYSQIINYYKQNQSEFNRILETEVDVSVEKDGYILTGKVDLLMGDDGQLEVLDFKTSPKPKESLDLLASYERQLCTYAHILEQRYGKHPERLLLYWTSEASKEEALMSFPYRPERVDEAGLHFDSVVEKIMAKEFRVVKVPETNICSECDLRRYCIEEGTIQ